MYIYIYTFTYDSNQVFACKKWKMLKAFGSGWLLQFEFQQQPYAQEIYIDYIVNFCI